MDISLNSILIAITSGNLDVVGEHISFINDKISYIMSKENLSDKEVEELGIILRIGNIIYNNTDLDDYDQPIENGVYDILLEKYKKYNPDFQVGAEVVLFNNTSNSNEIKDDIPMIRFIDKEKYDDLIYKDNFLSDTPFMREDLYKNMITFTSDTSRVYRDTTHSNPELVGSLDKCKYVLNIHAKEKGVYDDPNVTILERDFFGNHFKRGIINNSTLFRMVLELKYDGASVVVSIVNGMVVKAETRGDTDTNLAADVTPLLYGYTFPRLPKDISLDCKCEVIMTYSDLYAYNTAKNKEYKNCRSAVNGLFTSLDGYKYQEFVTLIPLKITNSSIDTSNTFDTDDLDRIVEIEFMNKYLIKNEPLRHVYIEGDYTDILFKIKRFVEEAEYVRDMMPYMYDGVVLSYIDDELINILGRENAINKYSVAIKFNAAKKQTVFRGYTFTVGQDGSITPMAHYNPVEFFGTIHPKSSISSYNRFMNLSLKEGDIIQLEYVNDVMPYVYKPDIDHNIMNPNPVIPFITECPSCHSVLQLSSSGKSCKCNNIKCPQRNIQRISNMMDKLDLRDFAEANMEKIGKYSLKELLECKEEDLVDIIGEANSSKFIDRMNSIKNDPINDFDIVGSLGFTGIAQSTWEKIFKVYTIQEIMMMYAKDPDKLRDTLLSIRGIGPITADTIVLEIEFFYNDLMMICGMHNIKSSKGISRSKIRFTGFRDRALVKKLQELGFDAGEGSVTKDTEILLVPNSGYSSSKTKSASDTTLIIPVDKFRYHIDKGEYDPTQWL